VQIDRIDRRNIMGSINFVNGKKAVPAQAKKSLCPWRGQSDFRNDILKAS
jgi:hypothetical protein